MSSLVFLLLIGVASKHNVSVLRRFSVTTVDAWIVGTEVTEQFICSSIVHHPSTDPRGDGQRCHAGHAEPARHPEPVVTDVDMPQGLDLPILIRPGREELLPWHEPQHCVVPGGDWREAGTPAS
ncbi:unnamed protein product [Gadus morhua 'NCC']